MPKKLKAQVIIIIVEPRPGTDENSRKEEAISYLSISVRLSLSCIRLWYDGTLWRVSKGKTIVKYI
ncbi:MAG: hypothetical protein R2766_04840 [Saprospiraceae bacterium]